LDSKELAVEKNSLRHKKMEISEHQMKEKLDCWKDIALLKKELRERQREYTEKKGRLNMLNELLDGQ
jgi:nitrate/TMAO reductase-like tetraheme cytochrome c subunit